MVRPYEHHYRFAAARALRNACRRPICRRNRRCLGRCWRITGAYERVSEYLAAMHFADPIHGRIYQSIARRIEAGQLADAITLKAEFEHSGVLEEVGGTAYLAQLLSSMVGIINAGRVWPRDPRMPGLRRQLIDIGETVVNNGVRCRCRA